MANREELERAIERLEGLNEVFECDGNLEDSEAAGIAIALCRAELTRQENAPLTCVGCLYSYGYGTSKRCDGCIRNYRKLADNYYNNSEQKGEKE